MAEEVKAKLRGFVFCVGVVVWVEIVGFSGLKR